MELFQTSFNHKATTVVKLIINQSVANPYGNYDSDTFHIKTLAELNVPDHSALHEALRCDASCAAYQTWEIHEAIVNGVLQKSDRCNISGTTYFGSIRSADEMRILARGFEPQPYTDKYPEYRGRFFVTDTGNVFTILLEEKDFVYDRATGMCLWPRNNTCSPATATPSI